MLRAITGLVLLGALLTAGARPVQAGYEWCSVDPTLAFTRDTLQTALLDVQVQVPFSALPLDGLAQLTVRVPSNVDGAEVLNTSVPPLFTLTTSFAQVKPAVSTSLYEVDLVLRVPSGKHIFPVRLVVSNPSTGAVTTTDGVSGKPLRQTVGVVE